MSELLNNLRSPSVRNNFDVTELMLKNATRGELVKAIKQFELDWNADPTKPYQLAGDDDPIALEDLTDDELRYTLRGMLVLP